MQGNREFGYSHANYLLQVGDTSPKLLLGDKPWKLRAKDAQTGKRTGEVENVVVTCYYPGLGSQKVYLPAAFELPTDINDMDDVELINPVGAFGRFNQVYVQADGLTRKEA